MTCPSCENVLRGGPTPQQQHVDPFVPGPAPYLYTCPECKQGFGSYDERREFWVEIDQAEALQLINSQPRWDL